MEMVWSLITEDASKAAVAAAWLTAVGAIFAAVVAALVSYLVARRSVYINAVTSERSKWIAAMRDTIAGLSGAADRVSSRKRQDSSYENSPEWARDVEEVHRLFRDLSLRLNPTEKEASNLLEAARKLEAAVRLHLSSSVILADEIMTRHARWVMKAEWERVKQEAFGFGGCIRFWWPRRKRAIAYAKFLQNDGSMERLNLIGEGKSEAELTLARTAMDAAMQDAPAMTIRTRIVGVMNRVKLRTFG